MQIMNAKQHQVIRGEILRNEPMSKHTSWRTGGVAKVFFKPADLDDLCLFMSQQDDSENIMFVGLGSNLLVRDAGIDTIVICTSNVINKLEITSANSVYVESGVASPKVAKFSAKNNFTGSEFLCGIPGTFGGALAMNAGAMGGETWNIVKNVTTINRQGDLRIRDANEFDVAYRSVVQKEGSDFRLGIDEWFVAANIELHKGVSTESEKKIKSHLARRGSTQPTQQPNAGSVFRNPDGDYAARLIELSGLKGFCIGGACVSEKHANFIINTGTATSSDIEELISHVQQTVRKEHEIELIREVRVIGKQE